MSGSSLARAGSEPRRTQTWLMVWLYFAAILIMYVFRTNLSFAINGANGMATKHSWTKGEQGRLLSGFFWGYLTSQSAGGWLATRFGGKPVLLFSMLLCSLLTALMPWAAQYGVWPVFAARVMLGAGSGVLYPNMMAMYSRWVTLTDRTRAFACSDVGGVSGAALVGLLAPVVMPDGSGGMLQGWAFMFNYPAAFGLLWCAAWYFLAASGPDEHPRISASECEWIKIRLIEEAAGKPPRDPTARLPWRTLLCSPILNGQYVWNTSANWMFYQLLTFLPQYMTQVLQFDITKAGALFAVPYLCTGIGELAGSVITDFLIGRGFWVLTVRTGVTLFFAVPLVGSYLSIALADLGVTATVVAFGVTMFCFGAANVNQLMIANDLYPGIAGPAFGVCNTYGTLPGVIAPLLTGYMLQAGNCPNDGAIPESCKTAWSNVFLISIGIYTAGACIAIVLIRMEHRGISYHALALGNPHGVEPPGLRPERNEVGPADRKRGRLGWGRRAVKKEVPIESAPLLLNY